MNTTNFAAIVLVALLYLILSLVALVQEYFNRSSEDKRILAIFYNYAALGILALALAIFLFRLTATRQNLLLGSEK